MSIDNGYTYGTLLIRENRFIAQVEVDGKKERVHVPNTGRLPQLLYEGAKVQLRKSDNPNRKTKYSLIAAKKDHLWVNIDSQLPNQLAYQSIENGTIEEFKNVDHLKREVTFGNSRFDLYYEKKGQKGFIEVKGVTLMKGEEGRFPDAPTTRGTKHIYEMIQAIEAGYQGTILFIIMRENASSFRPHWEIDEEFSKALQVASKKGVRILAYRTKYEGTTPIVYEQVPVNLNQE